MAGAALVHAPQIEATNTKPVKCKAYGPHIPPFRLPRYAQSLSCGLTRGTGQTILAIPTLDISTHNPEQDLAISLAKFAK
jgi:hypothetical protein